MSHSGSSGLPTADLLQNKTSWDSNDSVSASADSNQDEPTELQTRHRDKSLHVSVQRAEISTAIAREGNDELEELDVEAYDQHTYEEGVFEQVNRVLSDTGRAARSQNEQPSQSDISDLMRLIHEQEAEEQPEPKDKSVDSGDRDEQVLRLARAERLNRKAIKIELKEPSNQAVPTNNLPRIPRLGLPVKSEPTPLYIVQPIEYGETSGLAKKSSSSKKRIGTLSSGITLELHNCDESDSDHSSVSQYNPLASENGENSVEHETDSDGNMGNIDDDNVRVRRRSRKSIEDDGDFRCYQARMKTYAKERACARLANILDDGTEFKKLDEMVNIEGDLQIPKEMWENLFEHQKTGVKWLWELHQLGVGGILGDEMGLGKTIQMIAFLTALKTSNVRSVHNKYENLGPTVLVCPATVMHQWLMEFRTWWPKFRVAILHSTGTFAGDRKQLVDVIHRAKGILIVSYPGVIIYQDYLHKLDWHYAILDEGHKIRNPDAQVTLACKRFRTPHRIILSGSPVQNNLKELWSIFDFIYPGKLGTLPVFMGQFGIPITQGGYANATDIQVQIAYKCACVLRDTIKPFLLRRTKAEVNNKLKLPDRSEQVLFCKLTDRQRRMYQAYLDSPAVRDIKRGALQIFVGLIQLRKICNHPDIFDSSECQKEIKQRKSAHMKKLEFFSEDETFGHPNKSGKMMVVDALLKLWKKQNHKVLLFTQSRQMLKIFSNYLSELNYKYLTMDGATPIGTRQALINQFNKDEEMFIFLLTTRVGGVGINLVGANRIIIYDPDWNPSTDIQARERAWRIGQKRHVIIYRLLTAGTIEEKIYHRQVFKMYLTNRVLKDAKQKRFFKTNDLHELFTLGDNDKNIETKALFDDDLQINADSVKKATKLKKKQKESKKRDKKLKSSDGDAVNLLTDEQREVLRDRARRLSQMIASRYGSAPSSAEEQARVKLEPTGTNEPSTSDQCQASGVKANPNQKSLSRKAVKYLVKQDVYRPHGGSNGKRPDPRYKRDDYILEQLFKKSNISGALKHDKIETDSTADFKVVEGEAEKVARDAIRALRESRLSCLGSTTGIPNWTGRNGQMISRQGLQPKNKKAAHQLAMSTSVASSSKGQESILGSIKRRQQLNSVALARSTFAVGSSADSEDQVHDRDFVGRAESSGSDRMADKVREYILYKSARSGEAQTDELLEFFKDTFTPDQTAVFKALLYKMCEFIRRGDKGFWLLKSEFRDT